MANPTNMAIFRGTWGPGLTLSLHRCVTVDYLRIVNQTKSFYICVFGFITRAPHKVSRTTLEGYKSILGSKKRISSRWIGVRKRKASFSPLIKGFSALKTSKKNSPSTFHNNAVYLTMGTIYYTYIILTY